MNFLDSPHIVTLPRGAQLGDLDAYIARLDADLSREATSYVFRTPTEFITDNSDASKEQGRIGVLRRTNHKPILLLTFNLDAGDYELFRLNGEAINQLTDPTNIPRLRQKDLEFVLSRAADACLLKEASSYHYVTPSLQHASQFLRLGDALSSLAALDTLSFWLLGKVTKADLLVLDSWSISSLAIRPLQMLGKRHDDVPFDCLPGHPEQNREKCRKVLEQLLSKVPNPSNFLFLISVASSGKCIAAIQDLMGRDASLIRPIAIYKFASSPPSLDALCTLPTPITNYPPASCELCKKGSKAIPIDGRLYYTKDTQETEVNLSKPNFDEGRIFVEKYANVGGVFSVHRRDPNDGRHHAFYLDVCALLTESKFLAEYRSKLKSLAVSPDLIVTPSHKAGLELAKIASEILGVCHIVSDTLRSIKKTEDLEKLRKARNLLILDDVLISGTRLENYNRALREDTDLFSQLENIIFFIAVARPFSHQALDSHIRKLTKQVAWNASLVYVEKIFLPLWKIADCPWCFEERHLSRLCNTDEPPDWIVGRLNQLKNTELGIQDAPLFVLPSVSEKVLGNMSHAGPPGLNAIATLFSIASALQCLRSLSDTECLSPGFPHSRVFGIKNLERYNEGLILACFLRLVQPSEWGERNQGPIARLFLDKLNSNDMEICLGELILADAKDSVKQIRGQEFNKIIKDRVPSCSEEIQKLLKLV